MKSVPFFDDRYPVRTVYGARLGRRGHRLVRRVAQHNSRDCCCSATVGALFERPSTSAGGPATETGRGKWPTTIVGALSERPSTSAGGRGRASTVGAALAPPGSQSKRAARVPPLRWKPAGMPEAGKRFWLDSLLQRHRIISDNPKRSEIAGIRAWRKSQRVEGSQLPSKR